MKFLPLAVWAVGCLFVAALDEHWNRIDGTDSNDIQRDTEAGAKIFIGGCIVFIILGFL